MFIPEFIIFVILNHDIADQLWATNQIIEYGKNRKCDIVQVDHLVSILLPSIHILIFIDQEHGSQN